MTRAEAEEEAMKVVCPNCGRKAAVSRELAEYRYNESGLKNVRLKGGVTETTCSECGETYVRVEKEPQLLQVIALGLLMKPGYLTGPEMKFLRAACEMTQAELAAELRHRRETVSERESKLNPKLTMAEEVLFRLVFLRSFHAYLSREGKNHLTDAHREQLSDFSQRFCEFASQVGQRMLRYVIALEEREGLWHLGAAA